MAEWDDVVEEMMSQDPQPGHLFEHKWLYERLGIELSPGTPWYKAKKATLAYMGAMSRIREKLLEGHKICLGSQKGVGYIVIPPGEQTQHAMRELGESMHRGFEKAHSTIANVREDALTAEQERERSDALARLGAVKALVGERRLLPSS